jgi:outer membrane protein OmpA-like peptidoglycan-associated protein
MLTANKYTYGSVTRSHLAWFDLIVRRVAADWWSNPTLSQESSYRLHNICQHLGLAPDPKAGSVTHRYKMTITGSGLAGDVGIGLGGFIGAFRMQKTDSQTWQEDYTFWNAGISAGVSIGVEAMLDNDGEASSTSEWRPGDVPGWYTILDESSGFALGVGPSFGVGVMAVYGSGAHPPLAFITSPWSMAAGASGTLIDLGMSWGYIHEAGTNLNRQDASHIKHKNDYAVESEKTQEIHFRLGSAILTQEARQIVREMCAIELASFMSVGSVLVIIGHADRLDTENRNLELSKLRAENALQAIKDILGDQLKIPSNQISVHGAGELKAEYAGDADETPNPKWRKVEVILNSTLILTLRGD